MVPPIIALGWPKTDYCLSLEAAGAIPRVIAPEHDSVEHALDGANGLLLTGGADVDPRHYGATDRHATLSLSPGRDEYEIALAHEAMQRDLPLFAICRGAQLLNVAAGGSLVQDLPTQRHSEVRHSVKESEVEKSHTVRIAPDTTLARALGAAPTDLPVNSRHHQAVDRVADTFVVSAVAPDGIVEGIERLGSSFCVGVQWHPENYWATGDFASLFTAFINAARAHAAAQR